MVDLGTLEIALRLDKNGVDRDISGIRKELEELYKLTETNTIAIKPKVDHAPLTALNKHLDKKVKHLKEVRAEFKNNPIEVEYNETGESGGKKKRKRKGGNATASQGEQDNNSEIKLANALQQVFDKSIDSGVKSLLQGLPGPIKSVVANPLIGFIQGFTGGLGGTVSNVILNEIKKAVNRTPSQKVWIGQPAPERSVLPPGKEEVKNNNNIPDPWDGNDPLPVATVPGKNKDSGQEKKERTVIVEEVSPKVDSNTSIVRTGEVKGVSNEATFRILVQEIRKLNSRIVPSPTQSLASPIINNTEVASLTQSIVALQSAIDQLNSNFNAFTNNSSAIVPYQEQSSYITVAELVEPDLTPIQMTATLITNVTAGLQKFGQGVQVVGSLVGRTIAPLYRMAGAVEDIVLSTLPYGHLGKKMIQGAAPVALGAGAMHLLPGGVGSGLVHVAQSGLAPLTGMGASAISGMVADVVSGLPLGIGPAISGNVAGLLAGGAETIANLGGAGLAMGFLGKGIQNVASLPFKQLDPKLFAPNPIMITPASMPEKAPELVEDVRHDTPEKLTGKKQQTLSGTGNNPALPPSPNSSTANTTNIKATNVMLALPSGANTASSNYQVQGLSAIKSIEDLTRYLSAKNKDDKGIQLFEKGGLRNLAKDLGNNKHNLSVNDARGYIASQDLTKVIELLQNNPSRYFNPKATVVVQSLNPVAEVRKQPESREQQIGDVKQGASRLASQIKSAQSLTDLQKALTDYQTFSQSVIKLRQNVPVGRELNGMQTQLQKAAQQGMIQVAKAIDSGLGNNVTLDQASKVLEKEAPELIATVKRIFGIASPSKVFMYIGRMLMEGLSIGLTSDKPINVLDRLANRMKKTVVALAVDNKLNPQRGSIDFSDALWPVDDSNPLRNNPRKKQAPRMTKSFFDSLADVAHAYKNTDSDTYFAELDKRFQQDFLDAGLSQNEYDFVLPRQNSLDIQTRSDTSKLAQSQFEEFIKLKSAVQKKPVTAGQNVSNILTSLSPVVSSQVTKPTAQKIVDTIANEVRNNVNQTNPQFSSTQKTGTLGSTLDAFGKPKALGVDELVSGTVEEETQVARGDQTLLVTSQGLPNPSLSVDYTMGQSVNPELEQAKRQAEQKAQKIQEEQRKASLQRKAREVAKQADAKRRRDEAVAQRQAQEKNNKFQSNKQAINNFNSLVASVTPFVVFQNQIKKDIQEIQLGTKSFFDSLMQRYQAINQSIKDNKIAKNQLKAQQEIERQNQITKGLRFGFNAFVIPSINFSNLQAEIEAEAKLITDSQNTFFEKLKFNFQKVRKSLTSTLKITSISPVQPTIQDSFNVLSNNIKSQRKPFIPTLKEDLKQLRDALAVIPNKINAFFDTRKNKKQTEKDEQLKQRIREGRKQKSFADDEDMVEVYFKAIKNSQSAPRSFRQELNKSREQLFNSILSPLKKLGVQDSFNSAKQKVDTVKKDLEKKAQNFAVGLFASLQIQLAGSGISLPKIKFPQRKKKAFDLGDMDSATSQTNAPQSSVNNKNTTTSNNQISQAQQSLLRDKKTTDNVVVSYFDQLKKVVKAVAINLRQRYEQNKENKLVSDVVKKLKTEGKLVEDSVVGADAINQFTINTAVAHKKIIKTKPKVDYVKQINENIVQAKKHVDNFLLGLLASLQIQSLPSPQLALPFLSSLTKPKSNADNENIIKTKGTFGQSFSYGFNRPVGTSAESMLDASLAYDLRQIMNRAFKVKPRMLPTKQEFQANITQILDNVGKGLRDGLSFLRRNLNNSVISLFDFIEKFGAINKTFSDNPFYGVAEKLGQLGKGILSIDLVPFTKDLVTLTKFLYDWHISPIFSFTGQQVKKGLDNIGKGFSNIFESLNNWWQTQTKNIRQSTTQVVGNIGNGINNKSNELKQGVSDLQQGFSRFWTRLVSRFNEEKRNIRDRIDRVRGNATATNPEIVNPNVVVNARPIDLTPAPNVVVNARPVDLTPAPNASYSPNPSQLALPSAKPRRSNQTQSVVNPVLITPPPSNQGRKITVSVDFETQELRRKYIEALKAGNYEVAKQLAQQLDIKLKQQTDKARNVNQGSQGNNNTVSSSSPTLNPINLTPAPNASYSLNPSQLALPSAKPRRSNQTQSVVNPVLITPPPSNQGRKITVSVDFETQELRRKYIEALKAGNYEVAKQLAQQLDIKLKQQTDKARNVNQGNQGNNNTVSSSSPTLNPISPDALYNDPYSVYDAVEPSSSKDNTTLVNELSSLKKAFGQAMKAGDIATAIQILTQISQLDDKYLVKLKELQAMYAKRGTQQATVNNQVKNVSPTASYESMSDTSQDNMIPDPWDSSPNNSTFSQDNIPTENTENISNGRVFYAPASGGIKKLRELYNALQEAFNIGDYAQIIAILKQMSIIDSSYKTQLEKMLLAQQSLAKSQSKPPNASYTNNPNQLALPPSSRKTNQTQSVVNPVLITPPPNDDELFQYMNNRPLGKKNISKNVQNNQTQIPDERALTIIPNHVIVGNNNDPLGIQDKTGINMDMGQKKFSVASLDVKGGDRHGVSFDMDFFKMNQTAESLMPKARRMGRDLVRAMKLGMEDNKDFANQINNIKKELQTLINLEKQLESSRNKINKLENRQTSNQEQKQKITQEIDTLNKQLEVAPDEEVNQVISQIAQKEKELQALIEEDKKITAMILTQKKKAQELETTINRDRQEVAEKMKAVNKELNAEIYQNPKVFKAMEDERNRASLFQKERALKQKIPSTDKQGNPVAKDEIINQGAGLVTSMVTAFNPKLWFASLLPVAIKLIPTITALTGAFNMLSPLLRNVSANIEKLSSVQNKFNAVSVDPTVKGKEFDYVKGVSNKLGISAQVGAEQYTKLYTAARGTKLQGAELKQLFEGVSASVRTLNLTTYESELVFNAYAQILSKGQLSMEELRQQLGEKFPPAMGVFARSLGVSVAELDALTSKGAVLSDDVLSKVGKQLKLEYDPIVANVGDSYMASLNRFKNAVMDINIKLIDTFQGLFIAINNILAEGAKIIANSFDKLKTITTTGIIGVTAVIAVGLTAVSQTPIVANVLGSFSSILTTVYSRMGTALMPFAAGIGSDLLSMLFGNEQPMTDMLKGLDKIKLAVMSIAEVKPNKTFFGELLGYGAGLVKDTIKGIGKAFMFLRDVLSGPMHLVAMVLMFEQIVVLSKMYVIPTIANLAISFVKLVRSMWLGVTSGKNWKNMIGEMIPTIFSAKDAMKGLILSTEILAGTLLMMFARGDFANPLQKAFVDLKRGVDDLWTAFKPLTELVIDPKVKMPDMSGGLPVMGLETDFRALFLGQSDKSTKSDEIIRKAGNPGFFSKGLPVIGTLSVLGWNFLGSLFGNESAKSNVYNTLGAGGGVIQDSQREAFEKRGLGAYLPSNNRETMGLRTTVNQFQFIEELQKAQQEYIKQVGLTRESIGGTIENIKKRTSQIVKEQAEPILKDSGLSPEKQQEILKLNTIDKLDSRMQTLGAKRSDLAQINTPEALQEIRSIDMELRAIEGVRKNVVIEVSTQTGALDSMQKQYEDFIRVVDSLPVNIEIKNQMKKETQVLIDEINRIKRTFEEAGLYDKLKPLEDVFKRVTMAIQKMDSAYNKFLIGNIEKTAKDRIGVYESKVAPDLLPIKLAKVNLDSDMTRLGELNKKLEEYQRRFKELTAIAIPKEGDPRADEVERMRGEIRQMRQEKAELSTSIAQQEYDAIQNRVRRQVALRDFDRSQFDLAVQIDNAVRQRAIEIRGLLRQQDDQFNQNRITVRNIMQSYVDLNIQVNRRAIELKNNLDQVTRNIARMQLGLELNRLANPGDGLFNGFIDIFDRISQAFDNYNNEQGSISLQALDTEQQRLQVARQVRDIQEQIYNYELQRIRQAEDLMTAHETFIKNQANTWLGIQRQVENMETQAKSMGVSFSAIAYTLDSMNQVYAQLYAGLLNMSIQVGGGFSGGSLMMGNGANGVVTGNDVYSSLISSFGDMANGANGTLPPPPMMLGGNGTNSGNGDWSLPTIQQMMGGSRGVTLNGVNGIVVNGQRINLSGNGVVGLPQQQNKPIIRATNPSPPNYGVKPNQPNKPEKPVQNQGTASIRQTHGVPSSANNRVYLTTPNTNVNPQTGKPNKATLEERRHRAILLTTGNEFYQGGIPIMRNPAIIADNKYSDRIIAKDSLTKFDDMVRRGEIIVKIDPKTERILSYITTTGTASRLLSNSRFNSPMEFKGTNKDNVNKLLGTWKQRVINRSTVEDPNDLSKRPKNPVSEDNLRKKHNWRVPENPNPNKSNDKLQSRYNDGLLIASAGMGDLSTGLFPPSQSLAQANRRPLSGLDEVEQQKQNEERLDEMKNQVNGVVIPVRSFDFVDPRMLSQPTPIIREDINQVQQKEDANYRMSQEVTVAKTVESLVKLNTELRRIVNDVVNLRRRLEDDLRNMQRTMATDAFALKEFLFTAKGNFATISETGNMARDRANNETQQRINELSDKILERRRQVNVTNDGITETTEKLMTLFEKNKIQVPTGLKGKDLEKWAQAQANLPDDQKLLISEMIKALETMRKVVEFAPQFIASTEGNIAEVEKAKEEKANLAERQGRIQASKDFYSRLASENEAIGSSLIQARGANYGLGFDFRRAGALTALSGERTEALNPDLIRQTVANYNEVNPNNPITEELVRNNRELGFEAKRRQILFDTSGYNEMKTEFGQLADMMNSIGGQLNQRGDIMRGNWLNNSGQSMQVKIQSNDMRLELKRLADSGRITQERFNSLSRSIDQFEKNSLAKMRVDNNFIVAGLVEPIKGAITGMATIMIDKSKSFWEKVNDIATNFLTGIANHFANNFSTAMTTWITEWLSRVIPVGLDSTTNALDMATSTALNNAGISLSGSSYMLGDASRSQSIASWELAQAAAKLNASIGGQSQGNSGGILQSVLGAFMQPIASLGFGSIVPDTGALSGALNVNVPSVTDFTTDFTAGGNYGFAKGIKLNPFENYAKGGLVADAQKALAKERLLGGGKAVLSALTAGEYVVPKNPTKKDMANLFASVPMARNMQIENYAKGGMVGKASSYGSMVTNNSRMESRDNSFTSNIYVTANDASSFRKTRYQLEMEENARIIRASRRF